MTTGTRTLILVPLVLIIGGVIGFFLRPPVTQKTPKPKSYCANDIKPPVPPQSWKLFVGPDSNGNPCKILDGNGVARDVVVIKQNGDTVEFAPQDATTKHRLAITIHVPADASALPFDVSKLTFRETDANGQLAYILVCADPSKPCSTGPATVITTGDPYCYYVIDQTLDGKTCDAGIIIER